MNVVLEIKGRQHEDTDAKHQAAKRWISAVNHWGMLGEWDFLVCREPQRLADEFAKLMAVRTEPKRTVAAGNAVLIRGRHAAPREAPRDPPARAREERHLTESSHDEAPPRGIVAPMERPKVRRPSRSIRQQAQDAAFKRVHGGNLVYNACWEDPRIDRCLLALDASSRVVMITSAGCNALDYLLDDPREIHAVDMNPRQNALLQLKVAMIGRDRFEDLFALFGEGAHPRFKEIRDEIAADLHPYALRYWRAKGYYFKNTPLNPSFYYRGTAGQMAWIALKTFIGGRGRIRDYAAALLEAGTIEEQRALYEQVRPVLWTRLVTWLLRQPVAMAMLGVPRAQVRLIESNFQGGVTGFLQAKLERVLTEIPFRENYFWQVYLRGRYTRECCPEYLREPNQPALRARTHRIKTHSTTIANFLREHPGAYSHYVLLDHQDWMAAHRPEALEEEWRLILENSAPGTAVLMRSASPSIDFIPAFARERLAEERELAESLHRLDRVGTYGCTFFARIQG